VAATDAMHLLRGVDQKEEQREGARDGRGDLQWKSLDASEQGVEIRGGSFTATAASASRAEIFHGLKHRISLEPFDDLPER
jgi:hypothetical protein